MAILYFEVQAKYDKLIELQQKVEELKRQLSGMDLTITPKADVTKIQSELALVRKEMQNIYSSAAKAGAQLKQAFSGMQGATTSANKFADGMERSRDASEDLGSGIARFTKNFTAAALALKAIDGAIGAIKGGVETIVNFEAANSKLAAILGLTSDELREMTESAETLGRTTVYTASQVVELQTVLSKLGFTQKDILGMQESILYFAQATGSSLDDAAGLTGAALRMYGVEAEKYQEQVGRYTGAMAAATMRSALDFRSIADNLATFGPMAHAMNLEIEDTLALFGTLKNMGIEGSTAMTSLRNIFTKVAQGKIEGMGDVKSLEDFVNGLKKLESLDPGQGMKMIGPRGGTQFITLIQQAEKILELRDEIRSGASAETTASMGETMTQNVAGSIKMLQSAWEGFVLSFQKSSVPLKGVLDIVTKGIQGATEFVTSGKGDLPLANIQNLTGGIMAAVAAMIALKAEQKVVTMGFVEQKVAIESLIVEKGKDLDADLKLAVSRKMLTQEEANSVMAMREKARAILETHTAELNVINDNIKALTAMRARTQATLANVEAEIANAKAIMASAGSTERHNQASRLKVLNAQKESITLALNNSEIKLNTLEMQRNTLATEVNAMGKVLNAKATGGATAAQILFNKAMTNGKKALDILTMGILTNPYMMLAAAIGAVVYVIYDWFTAASATETAQNALNETMGEFSKHIDDNKSKAEQLRNVMKDQTATAYQQLKAYKDLIKTYHSFAGLTKEQIANMSDQEFQSKINAENDSRQKEFLENQVKALQELKGSGLSAGFSDEWMDALFGTERSYKTKFKEMKEKYGVDLSNMFDGLRIVFPDVEGTIDEALRLAYTKVAEFNAEMKESYTQAVTYSSEEAKRLGEIYTEVEKLQESYYVSQNGTSPIVDVMPDIDRIIAEVQGKIKAMQDEVQKHPNIELSVKIGEYEKVLADMEAYKRNLQLEMSKSSILIGIDWKPSPMPNLPMGFNFSSKDFKNAPVKEDTTAKEEDKKDTANKVEEARRKAEKIRSTNARIAKERKQQAYDDEIALRQAEIDAMEDGTDKKIKQIELNFRKEQDAIDKGYEKIKETYLNQERDIWLAKNPKSNEGDWLKSGRYKAVNASFSYTPEQTQKRENDLLAANAKRVNELMKLSESGQVAEEERLAKRKKYTNEIQSAEDLLQKAQSGEIVLSQEQNDILRKRIGLLKELLKEANQDDFATKFVEEFGSYEQRLSQLVEKYKQQAEKAAAGGNSSEAAYYTQKGKEAEGELAEKMLKDFTSSPDYVNAMSDALFSEDALRKVKEGMDNVMKVAASSMDTASFSKFLETYENISDRLISVNPFQALKEANADLKIANQELIAAKANYESVVATESGVQSKLGKEKSGYEEQLGKASTPEEAAKAQAKLDETNIALAQSYQRTKSALDAYNNAQAKVNNTTKQQQKASQDMVSLFGSVGDVFSMVGDSIEGSVGDALTKVGTLISASLNAINTIKTAGESSATGVAAVAQAVSQAVAILMIIQIAWQLINTIISIFDTSEKKYQERINALEGELDALEYQFESLKETMDEAWGLEAINAYTDAVSNLNNQLNTQAAIMESKLKKSSGAWIGGYHSLAYKINKVIRQSDWKKLTAALNAGGYEGTIGKVEDLLNLSPEALKYLMTTDVWAKFAAAISSQENKAYKGSEFLDDLQEYADMAKTLEEQFDELATKMNGISFDSLKEEFRSLVQEADTSINDITKSWDTFMRDAIYNQVATEYEKNLKDFYDKLTQLNQMKNEGKMTDAEYRAALAALKAEYQKNITNARNEYEQSLTDAGVNRTDIEQSSTQGGFESMSEDTGTELNGRFAAIQATAAAILDKISLASFDKMNANMDTITLGVIGVNNWVQETQEIIANSYLELQGIRENTETIIKPIKEMANNVQELKEKLI